MAKKHVVRIAPDGTIQFINSDALAPLKAQGKATLRRASHVEPANALLRAAFHALRAWFGEAGAVAAFTRAWPCRWRVNLGPSGGPILPRLYRDRGDAIEAEVAWLHVHRLGVGPAAGPTADGVVVQAVPAAGPSADMGQPSDRPEALAAVVTEYLDRLDRMKSAATLADAVRLSPAIGEVDRDELARAARAAHAEPVLLSRREIETILVALDPWGHLASPASRLRPDEAAALCVRLRRVGAYRLAAKLGG